MAPTNTQESSPDAPNAASGQSRQETEGNTSFAPGQHATTGPITGSIQIEEQQQLILRRMYLQHLKHLFENRAEVCARFWQRPVASPELSPSTEQAKSVTSQQESQEQQAEMAEATKPLASEAKQ